MLKTTTVKLAHASQCITVTLLSSSTPSRRWMGQAGQNMSGLDGATCASWFQCLLNRLRLCICQLAHCLALQLCIHVIWVAQLETAAPNLIKGINFTGSALLRKRIHGHLDQCHLPTLSAYHILSSVYHTQALSLDVLQRRLKNRRG